MAAVVARAVDRWLTVTPIGVSRFSVTAPTADLLAWLASIYVKSPAEVMTLFGWTPETVTSEDSAAPTVNVELPQINVQVNLPDRKTTSEIARDREGNIINIVQLERDA